MKFKRKNRVSNTAKRCSICGGQRRQFGWGNQKTKAQEKALKQIIRHEGI